MSHPLRNYEARLAFAQSILRSFALDELTDLSAQGKSYPEQIQVRLLDFMAQENHDAQNPVLAPQRKAKSGLQAGAGGRCRSDEVGIVSNIGDPGRLSAGPDLTYQSGATLESMRYAGRLKALQC